MDNRELTGKQRKKFYEECSTFDDSLSLEEYRERIRDYIFLVNRYDEQNENYTVERADDVVKAKASEIEALFKEREPVGTAVSEVEFFCG